MAVKKTVQSQRHKLQIYFLKVKKKFHFEDQDQICCIQQQLK